MQHFDLIDESDSLELEAEEPSNPGVRILVVANHQEGVSAGFGLSRDEARALAAELLRFADEALEADLCPGCHIHGPEKPHWHCVCGVSLTPDMHSHHCGTVLRK